MGEREDGFAALMDDVAAGKPSAPRPVTFQTFPWSSSLTAEQLTGLAIGMVYQKNPRESSQRWITIRSVSLNAPQKVMAYCWLRKAVKGFRLDRIQAVYDCDGVIMNASDFFGSFGVPIDDPAEPLPTANSRITLTITAALLSQIDVVANNRNDFVVEAIRNELQRRS